jgi:FkbM family methyltransferase
MIDENLIYDVGAHKGEDAEVYLKKGFRVIAIEANPEFCAIVSDKLQEFVKSGVLTVLNFAISNTSGEIEFYVDRDFSVFGTTNRDWVERNRGLGFGKVHTLTVKSARLPDIMKEYGVPRYCKIDIEGNDLEALSSLETVIEPPRFISIESDKTSWFSLLKEFETFEKLGYSQYKIVDQSLVPFQKGPTPPREGRFYNSSFEHGSTGLFGDELPEPWLDLFQALEAYKGIFRGYAINGDNGFFTGGRKSMFHLLSKFQERVFRFRGFKNYTTPEQILPPVSWYDTHAMRIS